jgi:phosphopantetheine binding protein/AMP-binding enzyme
VGGFDGRRRGGAVSPEHERLRALWTSRWPTREPGLVAFVIPHHGMAVDAAELGLWLAQRLPAPLLPARIVVAEELPRTPAGKVDRQRLQLPAEPAARRRDAVAPRGAVEARLAAMFADVLGAAPHDVHDDFFAHLGGHSLLATRLASLIRGEWSVAFELRLVFEHPTIAGLAECIEKLQRGGPAPSPAPAAIPRRGAAGGTDI